mgnify:CR=1 FL=1
MRTVRLVEKLVLYAGGVSHTAEKSSAEINILLQQRIVGLLAHIVVVWRHLRLTRGSGNKDGLSTQLAHVQRWIVMYPRWGDQSRIGVQRVHTWRVEDHRVHRHHLHGKI